MFEKTFCASPWFHLRINNSGHYEYCRWATKADRQSQGHISEESPIHWFQHGISAVRESMLQGQEVAGCSDCAVMEQHGKISGRQKQLLKTGVTTQDFSKSMLSSKWIGAYQHSLDHNGHTDQWPQDWQIDLGNFCNSACVFCSPYSSSRLASEFKKIGIINELPPRAWCDDIDLLDIFLQTLADSPSISYLHFIGGETMITPAFKTILQALVTNGLAPKVTVGFTTNLTVWDHDIVRLLDHFHQVNLGLSIECLHPLNDYVRYGSNISDVENMMSMWLDWSKSRGWLLQLRITPTVLSIWHLDTVYQFSATQGLAVESCNFLDEPTFMRPSVLPRAWRDKVIQKLQCWIDTQHDVSDNTVINTRNPEFARQQVIADAKSYVSYLVQQPDESHRLPDLIDYLQMIEKSRGNSLFDYLPEYEELFRSVGN